MIDLRSDTVTKPTAPMCEAMSFGGILHRARWLAAAMALLSACGASQSPALQPARARDQLPPARATAQQDIDSDGIPDVADVVPLAGATAKKESMVYGTPAALDGRAAALAKLPAAGALVGQVKAAEQKTTGA